MFIMINIINIMTNNNLYKNISRNKENESVTLTYRNYLQLMKN